MSKLSSGIVGASANSTPQGRDTPIQAALPQQAQRNPGWFRYKLGDIEVAVVTDGIARFKMPETHVANVKPEIVDAALAALFMDRNEMVTPYNPAVLSIGGKTYVVDTGLGEATYTSSNGLGGQFLTNLPAAGIDPKSVDGVILTHLHPDHINGLVRADGTPAFPNAEILIAADEAAYWLDDGEMSRAPEGILQMVFKNVRRVFSGDILKRTTQYQAGKEVVPGISAMATHGHSRGHNSLIVASGSNTMLIPGDVAHFPLLFLRNPDWHLGYDQDPVMAEATRRRVYDMVVAEKMLVQGFHFPFPALAHVEKNGNGYREIPLLWIPTI